MPDDSETIRKSRIMIRNVMIIIKYSTKNWYNSTWAKKWKIVQNRAFEEKHNPTDQTVREPATSIPKTRQREIVRLWADKNLFHAKTLNVI